MTIHPLFRNMRSALTFYICVYVYKIKAGDWCVSVTLYIKSVSQCMVANKRSHSRYRIKSKAKASTSTIGLSEQATDSRTVVSRRWHYVH